MVEKRFFALFVFVLVIGLTVSAALAADSAKLTGNLEAFRVVVNDEGVEDFVPADNARPNDVIEYRLTYTNTGREPVQNIFIMDPIPPGMSFVHPSATEPADGRVEFSIDGGKTYQAWPILVKQTNDEGVEEVVEATPDMVTHVRWVLTDTFQPEEAVTVSYRTVIK
ncbi:MAG: DUF11 domain-containing protein [Candidatus Latescibacterota bacterium]|nr:MAG: DUF11 domain-containing protein [Candidatus Latescibacterota bacterium]